MSSSPAKGTTALFQHSSGNFTKANRQAFLEQLNLIKPLLETIDCPNTKILLGQLRETRSSSDRDSLIYPTMDKNEIYVRNSTLSSVRHCCVDLLGLLPEKQDNLIREFLIKTETITHQQKPESFSRTASQQTEARQLVFGT